MNKLEETEKKDHEASKEIKVSIPLLAFTFFYSIALYFLMLSFYFWYWRKDIKQKK